MVGRHRRRVSVRDDRAVAYDLDFLRRWRCSVELKIIVNVVTETKIVTTGQNNPIDIVKNTVVEIYRGRSGRSKGAESSSRCLCSSGISIKKTFSRNYTCIRRKYIDKYLLQIKFVAGHSLYGKRFTIREIGRKKALRSAGSIILINEKVAGTQRKSKVPVRERARRGN
jgi:hypothetical protein